MQLTLNRVSPCPATDPSVLAVVAAEDSLGCELTQGCEAQAGPWGMSAQQQEDTEPGFPAA